MFKKFQPNEKVLCINNDRADPRLKDKKIYTVDRQTEFGYTWVKEINTPFVGTRFTKLYKYECNN